MAHSASAFAGVPSVSGFFDHLRALRAARAEASRRDRAYRTTYAQLDEMTDADLADIGISRHNIADIAQEAAARV